MTSLPLLEKKYHVTMVNCQLIVMSLTITEVLQRWYCHPENHLFSPFEGLFAEHALIGLVAKMLLDVSPLGRWV